MTSTGRPNEVKVLDNAYSAEVVVRRVRTTQKANSGGYFDDPAKTDAGELTKLYLTSSSLEGIVLKIKQHVDLLEDE